MIKRMDTFAKFKAASATQRRQMLKTWDIEYYNNDAPTITDEDYDKCLNYYNSTAKTKHVSSLGKASNRFPKFEHTYPVLSLDKIVTKPDFMKAARAFDFNCVLEPKLDGLTVVYYPDGKLVSRGNGHVGEILNADRTIPGLPAPYILPVRLEAVIKKIDFDTYFKEDSKKARNLAAGILRRKSKSAEEVAQGKKSLEDLRHITYYAYNILGADDLSEWSQMAKLKELGFTVPEVLEITTEADLNAAFDNMEAWSKKQAYWTDGVVVKANVAKNEKDFGGTAHHPNNAFAFKFVSMTEGTVLKKIRWSMGYDKLTPVGQFSDVVLGGSSVTQASLHNLNIMEQLGVKLGSAIEVTLKNEVIPQIVTCDGKGTEIAIPTTCPCCGGPLIVNSTKELVCENPQCKAKCLDTMNRIASKNGLDIEGLSNELLDAIYRLAKLENLDLSSPFAFLQFPKDIYRRAFDLVYITKARISDAYIEKLKDRERGAEVDLFAATEDELYSKIEADVQTFDLQLLNKNGSENSEDVKKARDIIAEHMEFAPFELQITAEDLQKAALIPERPLAATILGEVKRKQQNVIPANFLFACNVPELGINTAKLILKYFKDLEDLLVNWDTLVEVDGKQVEKGKTIVGIGEKIFDFINQSMETIRTNMQYVVSFAPNSCYEDEETKVANAAKLKICISGSLSKPKSYYEKLITEAGNIYVTSVTKDLSYLVSAETGTSKVVKAQKYGIPVLSEAQLLELLGKD